MWGVALPGMLPDDMTGLDAIELGCGTAYVSAWMARRGAKVVGIDNSERQLATARRLADEHGVELTLIHGNAETVPYPDGSFDFAISEYGAAIWCDPYVWIPEAHRLLRPGGTLAFLGTSTLAMLCSPIDGSLPITTSLERDYFAIHRLDWRTAVDEPAASSSTCRCRAGSRCSARRDSTSSTSSRSRRPRRARDGHEMHFFVTPEWAHRFPSEQAWVLRKRVTGARATAGDGPDDRFPRRQAPKSDLPIEAGQGRRSQRFRS